MRRNFNSFKDVEVIEYSANKAILDKLNHSRDIQNFEGGEVTFQVEKTDSILTITIDGEIKLNLISTYSFKPFKTSIPIHDILYFTDNEEFESEEVFLAKSSIDFDEIIYSLVLVSIPINPHDEGESTDNIDGIPILQEDEVEIHNSNFDDKLEEILNDIDEK